MSQTVRDWPQFGQGTLLAVHAHPDDESLSTGGLLAAWHHAGGRVVVITATRGERGETIGDEFSHLEGDHPGMAAHRHGELRGALDALGVNHHRFLDAYAEPQSRWADSGMAWLDVAGGTAGATARIPAGSFMAADQDAVVAALGRALADVRPRVVVTYGPDGGYGHPDHVRVHQVTMAAVRVAVERGAAPIESVLWRTIDPQSAAVTAAALAEQWSQIQHEAIGRSGHRRALRPPLPAASALPVVEDDLVRVPIAPVTQDVISALQAHRTQVQFIRRVDQSPDSTTGNPLVAVYALSNGVLQGMEDHETYRANPPLAPAKSGSVN